MNKILTSAYQSYIRSNADSLAKVYKNYSIRKHNAEIHIREEMYIRGGYDYRIIGHNSMMFSCGYKYRKENGKECFVYHTAENVRIGVIE